MQITDRGTVVASTPEHPSCAFASICVLPTGRWLCGFRAAPIKAEMAGQRSLLCVSDDEGRTWSDPTEPFAPPLIDGHPGLYRALQCTALGGSDVLAQLYWVDFTDPKAPFFNPDTEGLLGSRLFLARSSDGGETWSEPELVDTAPYNIPTAPTGPVRVLADGRWAMQFELNKEYNDPSEWHHHSVMMFSSDEGKTWPEHVVISAHPENRVFYWDQRPAVLSDGTILDLFWTYDRGNGVYLNIHGCESKDHGRTWSEMWDAGVRDQPAPPVSLPDGRVLMVYVDRTYSPVIKARASSDGGRTWPADTELNICDPSLNRQTVERTTMNEALAEMSAFSMGLPDTAPLPNGDVLVVYYRGEHPDHTDIEWARLA